MMFVQQKIVLCILLLKFCEKLIVVGEERKPGFRIAGGDPALYHPYSKYVVSVRTREQYKFFGDNHICCGSIISKRKILTAANCVQSGERPSETANDYIVIAGSPNRLEKSPSAKLYNVSDVIVHPEYRPIPITANIAVLVVTEDIEETSHIRIIHMADETPGEDTRCITLGWGRVFQGGPSPDEILMANLYVWSSRDCRKEYHRMKSCVFCAGDTVDNKKSSCPGDNGSPLICNGLLYGVLSFGVGCGYSSKAVDYLTDISCYKQWVQNSTRNTKPTTELLMPLFILWMTKLKYYF